ncbi:MAG TPA: hypothetical protein PKA88_18310 [Polyangiaceae bacterium]|nr:hypothetical protein [Polyangiaceae bacterium]
MRRPDEPNVATVNVSKVAMRRYLWSLVLLTGGCAASPQTQPATATYNASDDLALARKKNAEPYPDRAATDETESEPSDEIGSAPEPNETPVTGLASPAPHEPHDADVRLSVLDAESGKLAAVLRRLVVQIHRIDRDAGLEDRMLAHALLGRAYASKRQSAKARAEYDKVLKLWADPTAALKEIARASQQTKDELPRTGQALNAAGEALFFRAEQKRLVADALSAPKYRGPDTREAINKFMHTAIAPWVQKRRKLIDDAQRAYQRILTLRPVPPPQWAVAGAAQVSAMLDAFTSELSTVPMPPEIRKNPELRQVYEQSMHDAFAPMREAADSARRTCQEFARKFRVDSSYSRKCQTP